MAAKPAARKPQGARTEDEGPSDTNAQAEESVNGDVDTVLLSSAEYKSTKSRRSLTVYHIQRRLDELGYHDAAADVSSYYGDLTRKSVSEFQERHQVGSRDGLIDAETLSLLFANDENVRIGE
jgi:peptidoglycan hydrolase-like protein with peptidoglycan-binding domain